MLITKNDNFIVGAYDNSTPIDWDLGFKMIDDKGVAYSFTEAEETQYDDEYDHTFKSSWYLSKIQLPSTDEIYFSYLPSDDLPNSFKQKFQSQKYCPPIHSYPDPLNDPCCVGCMLVETTDVYETQIFDRKLLSEILFKGGKITFDYIIEDTDYYDHSENLRDISTPSLSSIKIYRKESISSTYELYRQYDLIYDRTDSFWKLLEEVKFYGVSETGSLEELPFYNFEYNEINEQLLNNPYFEPKSDAWGYFSEDGLPDLEYTKNAALTKIHNPTGGNTSFESGLNTKKLSMNESYSQEELEALTFDSLFEFDSDSYTINESGVQETVDVSNLEHGELMKSIELTHPQIIRILSDTAICALESDTIEPTTFVFKDVNGEIINNDIIISAQNDCISGYYEFCYYKIESNLLPLTLNIYFIDEDEDGWDDCSWFTVSYWNNIPSIFVGGLKTQNVKTCTDIYETKCVSKNYQYSVNSFVPEYNYFQRYYYECGGPLDPIGEICSYSLDINNIQFKTSVHNHHILYDYIEEITNDGLKTGKIVYYTTDFLENITWNNMHGDPDYEKPFIHEDEFINMGLPKKVEYYSFQNNLYTKIKEYENNYDNFLPEYNSTLSKRSVGFPAYKKSEAFSDPMENYGFYWDWDVNRPYQYNLSSQTEKTIENGEEHNMVTHYNYGEPDENPEGKLLEKIDTIDEENSEYLKTSFEYPYNTAVTGANLLKDLNIVRDPVKITTSRCTDEAGTNCEELAKVQKEFYQTPEGLVAIKRIKSSKGDSDTFETTTYHQHDEKGNPLWVEKTGGIHTVFIWGYGKSKLIAKIENATYTEVQNAVNISNIQQVSDNDDDRTIDDISGASIIYSGNEGDLREALNNLRDALPNAMVTTYTYDPLIGMTSTTGANGDVNYYEYDVFGRLTATKDKNGYILQEHEVHYKGEY